jgi:pSer/pThr/pTyr-binding forkhead associated (FHA) protein
MRFEVIAGPDKGRAFPLTPGETLLVGRSKSTQTRLTDGHISRVHCEVTVKDDQVTVQDANSAAGTFVNGQRVSRQRLQPGDLLRIGETTLCLQSETDSHDTLPPGAPPAPAAAPPAEPPAEERRRSPRESAPAPVKKLTDLMGQTLSHYELAHVLAAGHSGLVFQARDTRSGEIVAFKVLKQELSQNPEDRKRFIRGMKTMMPVRHPNIISIYNAGKTGGYCWIAMEYIEGESLTQAIRRMGFGGRLDWHHAFRVAVHISRALDFAHGQHIIHRDITPNNIMVQTCDRVAKLGDLMLAKSLEGGLSQQISAPGELVGDVHYMSPERTYGTADVDGRSDLYSLGATVYALLTGRPPFEGQGLVDTVSKIRTAEPVPPKKFQLAIPDLFEHIILKALAKRPADRYQSARALLTDLERFGAGVGVPA